MKLFTCTDHDYHWPVGVASIVLAESEAEARGILDNKLIEHGLKPFDKVNYTLSEIPLDKAQAIVLCDGEY